MKRQYFGIPPEFSRSANILGFRLNFHEAPIFCVFANILGKRQYFMILLDFVDTNICVYFQYLFMYFVWETFSGDCNQKDVGCMAAPSSSMAIVDFIPQSGTTLPMSSFIIFCTFLVLLQFFKRTRNKAFSEPRNTFLGWCLCQTIPKCLSSYIWLLLWKTLGETYSRRKKEPQIIIFLAVCVCMCTVSADGSWGEGGRFILECVCLTVVLME
jgi:hypothetical protein